MIADFMDGMGPVLWALLTLALLLTWVYHVWKLWFLKDDWWYGTGLEPANLYLMPLGLPLLIVGSLLGTLEAAGVPEDVYLWLLIPLGIPALLAMVPALLGSFGVPMPYPVVPRWVVERRRRDRAKKRQRKAATR